MKNSIKILAWSVAVLFALTATCPGQVTTVGKTIRSTGEKTVGKTIRSTGEKVVTGKESESSQELISLQKNKELHFSEETTPSAVKFNVSAEYNYLKVNIDCSLNSGIIAIELIDPNGKKQGIYTVKSEDSIVKGDKTQVGESAQGNMQKMFRNPLKGDWLITVAPIKAKGNVKININQQVDPRIDYVELHEVEVK
ncbi:MAG: hypothetical protein V2A67_00025 [Bacteroidota bacterium]